MAQEEIIDSEHTWEEYFEGLKNGGDKYIPDLIKNTEDLSKLTSKDLVNANQAARKAALDHNAALKKQTASAKAGKIAMSGLAMAGNMFVDMLITKGIELAVTAIDKYVNRVKYAQEAMEEAQQAIDEAQSKLNNTNQVVTENKKRFLELSNGVDSFSNNRTLSTDEYSEFLSISQKIAELSPDLIYSYDEQGNALLRLGKNAEETGKMLEEIVEVQQTEANKALVDNLDAVANGVMVSVEQAEKEIEDLKFQLSNEGNIGKNVKYSSIDMREVLKTTGGFEFDGEGFRDYGSMFEQALNKAGIGYDIYKDVNRRVVTLTDNVSADTVDKAQKYYNDLVEIQKKGYSAEQVALKQNIDEKEKLIDDYYSRMSANLVAWAKNENLYKSLDNKSVQTFVDSIIPKLDWNEIKQSLGKSQLDADDYEEYIRESIIKPLATVPDKYEDKVNEGIEKLLSFDEGDLNKVSFGENLQKMFTESNINIDLTPFFSSEKEVYNRLQESKDKFKSEASKLKEAKENLKNEYQKINDWGLNDYKKDIKNGTIQSIFGNVDMDKRTIITWSDELKKTYKEALDSWEYNPDIGSVDTVFGSSSRFGEDLNGTGWEVAFTPILPDGTFLSKDTVYDYIDTIVKEAYANDQKVTEDELKAIDAQGRKMGNTLVKGIFAGVDDSQEYDNNGNWAETVGRLMHFSGNFGAINLAKEDIRLEKIKKQEENFNWDGWFKRNSIDTEDEVNKWLKIANSVEEAANARRIYAETKQPDFSPAIEKMDSSLTTLTESQELFNTALSEQAQNGSISDDTLASLKDKYQDLNKVLEITSDGFIINKDKLAELNAEEQKSLNKDLTKTREQLVDQYNANSLAIAAYELQLKNATGSEAGNKEMIEGLLAAKREDQKQTQEQLAQLDLLGIEYDKLTSKTNRFLQSLSSADEGAIYDSVVPALEQIKQVYDAGDYGKDEFRNFVDLMSFKDMSTAPIEEVVDTYKKAMKTAERYFTENNNGVKNFANDLKKLNAASQDANGNWSLNIENMDELAKKLGISSDAADILLDKLKDKGWEVNFTATDDGMVDVSKNLDKLKNKLKKLKDNRLKLIDEKKSTEEIDKEINNVKNSISDIKVELQFYADQEDAKQKILDIQGEIDSAVEKNGSWIGNKLVEQLKEQQKKLAEEYKLDLDTVLKVDTDKANKDVKETKEKSKEDTTFEVDAKTKLAEEKINAIFNKTYWLNVGFKLSGASNIRNIISRITGKKSETGDSDANGTVITGKAYANGKRGKIAKGYKSKALVGELGAEMRVRDGKYEILGANGAEFTDVRPDDIIFNAKQTEEILKNGKTNIRGNAYALGANGGGIGFEEHTTSTKSKEAKKKQQEQQEEERKKKQEKAANKFSEVIDWCANSINKLNSVISNINAKLNSTTSLLSTRIKYYKDLINKQQSLVNGYSKSVSVYKKSYNNSLKKLSKSDREKVENGTYKLEYFKDKSNGENDNSKGKNEIRYDNIQKAIEKRDTYLDAQTSLTEAKNQLQEYAEALASVRWDKASEKVEKFNDQLDILDAKMSNVSGYKAKNSLLEQQLSLQKDILKVQENAYKSTKSDANSYYKKISSKYKKNKNADGTIKTTGVKNNNQLKYIKTYNAYVKKLAEETVDLAKAQEEYNNAVINAPVTRADNIKAEYDNKLSLIDAKKSKLESKISLTEAKGQVASAKYYELLNQNSSQRLDQLNNEKKSLEEQLSSVRKYSDAWYTIKNSVNDVDQAIATETQNAVENVNKQIEAMKQLTSQVNDYITSATDALGWYDALIEKEDMYDENGNISNKGFASLKLKEGQITGSKTRLGNYEKDLTALEKRYNNGKGDLTEAQYLTRKLELEKNIRDEYKTQIDIRKEENDIIKESYKAQKEALDELIDKKKKALSLDKSEYDYRKSITEKTKNIADLEKQLAMLQGDNSEEAKAQRQQIEVQLKDAQEDLADTQYEKYIERYEDAMDGLSDRLDTLIEKLDDLTGEEIAKIVVENDNSADKGIDEVSEENNVPKEVLGEVGKEIVDGSSDKMDETFNKANKDANTAYNGKPSSKETGKGDDGNISLSEALGKYDANNKKDKTKRSALNNYLTSQGYSAKNLTQMMNLTTAILQSPYSDGMNNDLLTKLSEITNKNQLDTEKDKNASANKNSILAGLKYVRANEFIQKNAVQTDKKKSEIVGILNKKIYDITKGKVLSKANGIKLASMFDIKDTDNSKSINGDEAKKLVKLLEGAGFSNGGIVQAVKKNGDDGLATLKVGESVLTPAQTTALMELGKNLVPLNNFMNIIQRPNIPNVERSTSSSTSIDSVNFEFNLPNVVDSESLIKTIQTDTKVQRTLQNATVGKLNGNTRFGVNRL